MNAAKAYRKLKEVEETKLSNRLFLLRLELARSHRKLAETEKRTQSIEQHQAELEAKKMAKMEEMKKKLEEQTIAQQINLIARTRMAIIRRTKVKSVAESKKEEAAQVMSARREHYNAIEAAKEEQLKRAMAVKNFVKATLEMGKEARKREMLAKREAARAAFAERVKTEAEKSKEAEQKVAIMEQEELRLIKLLEQTQEYQKHAYQQLESALLQSRKSVAQSTEELRHSMAATLTARSTGRLRNEEVKEIAIATLPPAVKKALSVPGSGRGSPSGRSTPRKPQPPTAGTARHTSLRPAANKNGTKSEQSSPTAAANKEEAKEEAKEETSETKQREEQAATALSDASAAASAAAAAADSTAPSTAPSSSADAAAPSSTVPANDAAPVTDAAAAPSASAAPTVTDGATATATSAAEANPNADAAATTDAQAAPAESQ